MADMKKTDAGTKTGWAKLWGNFEEKHPKLAKWLYQIFYFFVFSMGVTIIQYLFFTFMPGILGEGLAGTEFMWPQVHMDIFGVEFTWSLLGYNVLYDEAGAVLIGGGLGYFISYEVGSFVAQCINFPLQRNITFKSHGNVAYQAMWYFIAWIVISLICNGFNNLQYPRDNHHRGRVHGNLLLCIQDHLPGRGGEEELSIPGLRTVPRGVG